MSVPHRRHRVKALAVAAAAVILAGIGIGAAHAATDRARPQPEKAVASGWTAPPANATFDYQIGSPYTPPAGVTVVSRDYTAAAAPGIYNICYINAFQTQGAGGGEASQGWWESKGLVLKDRNGNPVEDEDWGEYLLDFSTAAKRTALARAVGGFMDKCAGKGFKAVELDNLDSFSRSNGLLKQADAITYAKLLADAAHGRGLATGQKNFVELSAANIRTIGFDFAVVEQCGEYDECDVVTARYGDRVIVIEYSSAGFRTACSEFGSRLSIVLRDVNVTAPGSSSYKYRTC
ncbi:endo alpha-1,4 polygalactosaminidase [Paractinoplanes hotanensis]|uniref:Endo alpha-1,4 polygalactosaminidase n=1 Tax=Paractinoplanes hotanensis TaxID=2906497 RepID=A0ABT0XW92_9ACTN|nr:endo alpha-1,4 polygalactosaminidase [Actinoplanes hotanensis]MCM4077997.1 endo alpha-1,4 polygalactosaminidase [Actinoplanes hotanensis]